MGHVVFLSSTFSDLQPERNAVRDAVIRLQYQYTGMEYFSSDPEGPKDVSLRLSARASIYVGIIAHRYGTIDTDSGKSITQLEYEAARAARTPTLIYFKDPSTPIEPTSRFVDFEPEYRSKLSEFKRQVQSQALVEIFRNPDDLAAKVTAAIAKLPVPEHELWWRTGCFENLSGMNDVNQCSIPMVGAVAVGKTAYGCALAAETTAGLAQKQLILEINHEKSDIFAYYECLKRGEWAPPTPPGQKSCAAFILRRKRLFGYQCYNLSLFDTSGEEWGNSVDREGGTSNGVRTIAKCAGLAIFLEVVSSASVAWDRPWPEHDPLYANIIWQLGRSDPGGRFRKPVALILTKCDLHPELLREPDRAVQYLHANYPLTDSQLRCGLSVFQVFATSAVGALDDNGKPQGLRPVGVWEPIMWLSNHV